MLHFYFDNSSGFVSIGFGLEVFFLRQGFTIYNRPNLPGTCDPSAPASRVLSLHELPCLGWITTFLTCLHQSRVSQL